MKTQMKKWPWACLSGGRWLASATLLILAASAQAQAPIPAAEGTAAQPIIEAVTGSLQSGAEVVKIDLSQPLAAVPNGFSIKSPAKIALDFPGVGNAMGRATVDVNQGNLRSVNLISAGDRTRVVLNLKQATNYKAELQGLVGVLGACGSKRRTGRARAGFC